MYCMICGSDEKAKLRITKGSRALCDECDESTPKKAEPTKFYKAMFGHMWEDIKPYIRRPFYNDYIVSRSNLSQYVKEQTETI